MLFEIGEAVAEGVVAECEVVVGSFYEIIVAADVVIRVDLGFADAEAADEPLVVDEGIDEVALARRGGAEFGVVFGGEGVEIGGVLGADHDGFRMKAGFEGVHGGDGFAGRGAGAGGFERIAAVGGDLSFGWHSQPFVKDWSPGRPWPAPTGSMEHAGPGGWPLRD